MVAVMNDAVSVWVLLITGTAKMSKELGKLRVLNRSAEELAGGLFAD